MKKLLSLSLVASVTIFALNASAQDLSEAIKGVDVSGTIAYRYNDYESNTGNGQTTTSNYKIGMDIKSPVNDDLTANTRVILEQLTNNETNVADSAIDFKLSEANFTYSGINNASITLGKQGVATPFTVHRDAMGSETTGSGISATYNIAPVTFAAAYFQNSNTSTAGDSIATFGVMGSFAGINADAWYIDIDNTSDAYTIGLNSSYKMGEISLNPSARYSKLDEDTNDNKKSLWKVGMNANTGLFDAYVGYGKTGKNGGVAIDGNSSSTTFDEHWRIGLFDTVDSSVLFANAGMQVTDSVHVSLRHSSLDAQAANSDETENYAQVVYQMSSNFVTYVRYGVLDKDAYTENVTMGRLHMQYSF